MIDNGMIIGPGFDFRMRSRKIDEIPAVLQKISDRTGRGGADDRTRKSPAVRTDLDFDGTGERRTGQVSKNPRHLAACPRSETGGRLLSRCQALAVLRH